MRRRSLLAVLAALVAVGLISSCTEAAEPAARDDVSAIATQLVIEVHRSATCGCCEEYETYLRDNGATVTEVVHDDIAAAKEEMGIPYEVWSCHTSIVEGYIVEGHVPLEAIADLLDTRPQIDGIGLAGMPAGSPGMGGVKSEPWEIRTIDGGKLGSFGTY
jgi:hypothetical protein